MKKFIISVLAISVLALSACGTIEDDPTLVTKLIGVLSEQSSSSDYPGTHLLMEDDLSVHPVNSMAINLSDPKYLNNKVELSGALTVEGDIFSVTGISVQDILSNTDTNESTLTEYMNSDQGFSIKYYSDWLLSEDLNLTSFISSPYDLDGSEVNDTVIIEQTPFSYSASVFDSEQLDSPLANYLATNFPDITDLEPFLVKIGKDQMEAVKLENEAGGTDYYMYRSGLVYSISFMPFDPLFDTDNLRIFNEMLSTFKFVGYSPDTDSGEIVIEEPIEEIVEEIVTEDDVDFLEPDVDFTSFDSLPYSFRASYPAPWYYAGTSKSGVLHHYGFSDESIEDDNELYSLDIVSEGAAAGKGITVNGVKLMEVKNGDNVEFYRELDNQIYKISGLNEFRDYMIVTATSIEEIEKED